MRSVVGAVSTRLKLARHVRVHAAGLSGVIEVDQRAVGCEQGVDVLVDRRDAIVVVHVVDGDRGDRHVERSAQSLRPVALAEVAGHEAGATGEISQALAGVGEHRLGHVLQRHLGVGEGAEQRRREQPITCAHVEHARAVSFATGILTTVSLIIGMRVSIRPSSRVTQFCTKVGSIHWSGWSWSWACGRGRWPSLFLRAQRTAVARLIAPSLLKKRKVPRSPSPCTPPSLIGYPLPMPAPHERTRPRAATPDGAPAPRQIAGSPGSGS